MDWVIALGFLAAASTTVSFLPQAVKSFRTRRTGHISFFMYLLFTSGVLLWTVYGVLIQDLPLILANGVTFTFALSVLILKAKHG